MKNVGFAAVFSLMLTAAALAKEAPEAEGNMPKRLSVEPEGSLQPGALFQGWWLMDYRKEAKNTFRLRRAEVSLKGQMAKGRVFFGLMIDPAKVLEPSKVRTVNPQGEEVVVTKTVSPIAALQDLFLGVSTPYVDMAIGQFKIPVSYEGYRSSAEIMFAERSLLSRGLGTLPYFGTTYKEVADELGLVSGAYGDKRDLGLRLEKRLGPVYYFVGIFNGSGANNLDKDARKDLAIRLEFFPTDFLVVGLAGYTALRKGFDTARDAKDRVEVNVRADVKPVLIQGEYIYARDYNPRTNSMTPSQGAYIAVAHRLPLGVVVAGRCGWWDLNIDADNTQVWEATGGIHYYFKGFNAILKLDYTYYHPTFIGLSDIHEVILAGQVRF